MSARRIRAATHGAEADFCHTSIAQPAATTTTMSHRGGPDHDDVTSSWFAERRWSASAPSGRGSPWDHGSRQRAGITRAPQQANGSLAAPDPDFIASGAVLGDAGERLSEGLRAAGRDASGDQPACCNPAVGLGISDLTAMAGFLG